MFARWMVVGEYADGTVGICSGDANVFERVPRDVAERIIQARQMFCDAIIAEIGTGHMVSRHKRLEAEAATVREGEDTFPGTVGVKTAPNVASPKPVSDRVGGGDVRHSTAVCNGLWAKMVIVPLSIPLRDARMVLSAGGWWRNPGSSLCAT